MKPIPLKHGTTISKATAIRAGVYRVDGDTVTVTGRGFTLDFRGVTLEGLKSLPHQFKGIGMRLVDCKDVAIVGLRVSGFHRGIQMENCDGVTLVACDASGNGCHRFYSTPEKYDKRDFLDIFHYRVWSKYASGIYLKNCRACKVLRCVASHQLNGIILDGSDRCLVQGNVCTKNRGWGVRLWGSSHNEIIGNDCSHCASAETPKYSYGNDSAGICIVNGCHHNMISGNDLRYSGDGLFLTADLGTELSNDNVIVGNDGSHSPHNSFESTFCLRNHFYNNIASSSHYGFWMGYSRENRLIGNTILGNREAGIAWEHGADSEIAGNHIGLNRHQGVLLFHRRADGPPSKGYVIEGNEFEWNGVGVELRACREVRVSRNRFVGTGAPFEADKACKGCRFEDSEFPAT